MAWRLGLPLITLACNEDITAGDLVGRWLLDAEGTRWQDGPLTLAARFGAICYLDEVVEARADTTVVIHPLTDARRMCRSRSSTKWCRRTRTSTSSSRTTQATRT